MKLLLKQIWNQKQMNVWIFVELLFVSAFLWFVIEPLYMAAANRIIPKGYDAENVYFLRLKKLSKDNPNYQKDEPANMEVQAYTHAADIVRNLSEVEAYSLGHQSCLPEPNMQMFSIYWTEADSTNIQKELDYYYENEQDPESPTFKQCMEWEFVRNDGSDIFKVYRMTDAVTGGEVRRSQAPAPNVYLTAGAAKAFFGTVEATGQKLVDAEKMTTEILGVVSDFKQLTFQQPFPLLIREYSSLESIGYNRTLFFRLKDGVDRKAFEKRFEKEIKPQLAMGNYILKEYHAVQDWVKENVNYGGEMNKVRMQLVLTLFSVLCIFLGMVGTFWLRCRARRSEIGLMRSMGATRRNIVGRMLLEAATIATIAYVLILPFMWYYASLGNLTVFDITAIEAQMLDMSYLQNRFWPHFLSASVIAYAVLILTALIGTWIPARQAAQVSPAEALSQGE